MRAYRKNKILLLSTLVALYSVAYECQAQDDLVSITKAKLSIAEDKATLNIRLNFHLSPSAEEALHSGIALYWDVSIALKQKQTLGYKALFSRTYRYSLTYYTLLNNFRVKDEHKNAFRRFATLPDALLFMQHMHTEEFALQGYNNNQCITTVLNISFDKEMLPAPLRPIAYFDPQWNLSAQERQWCE